MSEAAKKAATQVNPWVNPLTYILIGIGCLALIIGIYLMVDMSLMGEYQSLDSTRPTTNTKREFMEMYKGQYNDGKALDDEFTFGSDKPWDGVVNINTTLFNADQIKMNNAIIDMHAGIWSEEHLEKTGITLNNTFIKSFYNQINPMVPMAHSAIEWGGKVNLAYAFSPALAFKDLGEKGVPLNTLFDMSEVTYSYYTNLGINIGDDQAKGPMQILSMNVSGVQSKFPDCIRKNDSYNPYDAGEWYWHTAMDGPLNSANYAFGDLELKNIYQVLFVFSMLGSGYNQLGCHKYLNGPFQDVPWLMDESGQSEGWARYMDVITSTESIAIIRQEADAYIATREAEMAKGNYRGNLQINTDDAVVLRQKLVPDLTLYIDEKFVLPNDKSATVFIGPHDKIKQQVTHPIYTIFGYMLQEHFITGGGSGA